MQGICRTIWGALRLATVAGLLLLHGCAILEQELEPVEPVPEVVEVPEPVAEVPAPEPGSRRLSETPEGVTTRRLSTKSSMWV